MGPSFDADDIRASGRLGELLLSHPEEEERQSVLHQHSAIRSGPASKLDPSPPLDPGATLSHSSQRL